MRRGGPGGAQGRAGARKFNARRQSTATAAPCLPYRQTRRGGSAGYHSAFIASTEIMIDTSSLT